MLYECVYMECRLNMHLDNSTVAQHTILPRERPKSERECMFDKIVGISYVIVCYCGKIKGMERERVCVYCMVSNILSIGMVSTLSQIVYL